ncbi:MAG: hypothetical protein HS111_26445 [Kofleriaceae bacterium]|nr:hypothetical protein [Kofleriaceae bacterium]
MLAMIKINLLPSRKPRRQAEPGQRDVAVGVGALVAVAAVVFFVVHRPMASERDALREEADGLAGDNASRRNAIADMPQREAAFKAEEEEATTRSPSSSARSSCPTTSCTSSARSSPRPACRP